MGYTPEDLAMARRHVVESEERVSQQRQLVGRLEEQGEPTGSAVRLLETFEVSLEQMREHLVAIEADLRR